MTNLSCACLQPTATLGALPPLHHVQASIRLLPRQHLAAMTKPKAASGRRGVLALVRWCPSRAFLFPSRVPTFIHGHVTTVFLAGLVWSLQWTNTTCANGCRLQTAEAVPQHTERALHTW